MLGMEVLLDYQKIMYPSIEINAKKNLYIFSKLHNDQA